MDSFHTVGPRREFVRPKRPFGQQCQRGSGECETVTRRVALWAVVALALVTASCGASSITPVHEGNWNSGQVVPAHVPGAQPTAPQGGVVVPEQPAPPGQVDLPLRVPGGQPVDPGPVVVVPMPAAPPAWVPADTEPTPTTEPSEQLPLPEVP
jgi:hypothetical protein